MEYTPRKYQEDSITLLRESISKGNRKIMLALATGSGKSMICKMIVELAEKKNNSVLYTAPSRLLIDQMSNTMNGLDNVEVKTLQSAYKKDFDVDILLLDEAHAGSGATMQNKLQTSHPNAIIIGLSATPMTSEGYKLDGWDDLIDVIQMKELIELGYASDIKIINPMFVDTSSLKVTAGDFNQKQSSELVSQSQIIKDVVGKYEEYALGLKTIVYCVTIDHAKFLEDEFTLRGHSCVSIHSKLNKKETKTIFDQFKTGEIDIILNVQMLTTGIDMPDIYAIILASPIKSKVKAVQIYGRCSRLDSENPGKIALILDCANVIDNTVHPKQKLRFNIDKPNKDKIPKCKKCTGKMLLLKATSSKVDDIGVYMVTEYRKCDECGVETIEEYENIYTLSFCESCGEHIEKGTNISDLKIDDSGISFVSVCPHCGNEHTRREIGYIKEEIYNRFIVENIVDMNTLIIELKKVTLTKAGKKPHRFFWDKARMTFETIPLNKVIEYAIMHIREGKELSKLPSFISGNRQEFIPSLVKEPTIAKTKVEDCKGLNEDIVMAIIRAGLMPENPKTIFNALCGLDINTIKKLLTQIQQGCTLAEHFTSQCGHENIESMTKYDTLNAISQYEKDQGK